MKDFSSPENSTSISVKLKSGRPQWGGFHGW
jgi:hypothetical protein